MTDKKPNRPIRAREQEFKTHGHGKRFEVREVALSRLAGAEQIHVNFLVLPAGKQNYPFHYHLNEEEHFFVLEGRCVLRSGEERHTMEPGDYACFPAGTGVAHSFENPHDEDCTMLTIGPWDPKEVAVYPDSGKVLLRALERIVAWPQESMDYWDGERADEPLD